MGNELMPDHTNEPEYKSGPAENAVSHSIGRKLDPPSITTESLVPRLGESLLEAGVITTDQLQRALDYQKEQAANGKVRMLGQALSELGFVDQATLDRAIARQLMTLHDALQDANRQLEQRVTQRTEELERRIIEIRTAAEITQLAISTTSIGELLERTVNLIGDRFGYSQVTVFLNDPLGEFTVLSEASGDMGQTLKRTGYKIPIGSQSMVGWVAAHNQTRVSANVGEDPFYQEQDILPNIKTEATIPLSVNDYQGNPQVLGVLDVKHTRLNAFDQDTLATLQTVANHIAATISNLRLLQDTQNRLHEISSLYQVSHKIAKAEKIADIIDIAANSLKDAPLFSAVLLPDGKHMIVYQIQDRRSSSEAGEIDEEPRTNTDAPAVDPGDTDQEEHTDLVWPIISTTELMTYFKSNEYKLVDLENPDLLPHALIAIPRHFGCKAAVMIPVIAEDNLEAIFILGSRQKNFLTEETIQPYASLSQQTTTALEKVYALQKVERRLNALQTLNTVSQAVSIETDLKSLYRSVHNEVNQIMGDVSFIIALYEKETDLISIPYMYEEHSVKSVDPFPLGKGLTSIIIRTRQPLMIVEDTENRTRELGALVLGAPAKSWMGVPLLIGGEPIGAMIVQDLEKELRFDEDDLRLMSTLALQVAAGLRNARLLDNTYRQAERERLLHEISRKIRGSTDMQTILKSTAQELGKYTGARRVRIELGKQNGAQDKDENVNVSEKPPVPPFSSIEDSV